jgi:L-iditol 2-dehydrogenase
MLQQVMTAPGVIEFREIPVPELKPGEVLVRIEKIGV